MATSSTESTPYFSNLVRPPSLPHPLGHSQRQNKGRVSRVVLIDVFVSPSGIPAATDESRKAMFFTAL